VTYGDVIDKAARNNISICGRDVQDGRLRRLYVSQSNLLHIVFTTAASSDHHQQQQQQHNFIIHVEGTVLATVAASTKSKNKSSVDFVMAIKYIFSQLA